MNARVCRPFHSRRLVSPIALALAIPLLATGCDAPGGRAGVPFDGDLGDPQDGDEEPQFPSEPIDAPTAERVDFEQLVLKGDSLLVRSVAYFVGEGPDFDQVTPFEPAVDDRLPVDTDDVTGYTAFAVPTDEGDSRHYEMVATTDGVWIAVAPGGVWRQGLWQPSRLPWPVETNQITSLNAATTEGGVEISVWAGSEGYVRTFPRRDEGDGSIAWEADGSWSPVKWWDLPVGSYNGGNLFDGPVTNQVDFAVSAEPTTITEGECAGETAYGMRTQAWWRDHDGIPVGFGRDVPLDADGAAMWGCATSTYHLSIPDVVEQLPELEDHPGAFVAQSIHVQVPPPAADELPYDPYYIIPVTAEHDGVWNEMVAPVRVGLLCSNDLVGTSLDAELELEFRTMRHSGGFRTVELQAITMMETVRHPPADGNAPAQQPALEEIQVIGPGLAEGEYVLDVGARVGERVPFADLGTISILEDEAIVIDLELFTGLNLLDGCSASTTVYLEQI